jgi:hypothetical protein
MILVYRSLAWLFSRLADLLGRYPAAARMIIVTIATAICFVIAIGARSVLMEPTVPKTCFAIATVLGVLLALDQYCRLVLP